MKRIKTGTNLNDIRRVICNHSMKVVLWGPKISAQ